MIDVRDDQLKIIADILRTHLPETEVRAFGSRVSWTAKDSSDLDLVVMGKTKLGWKTMTRLKVAFEASSLPFRVDVLRIALINRPGVRKILHALFDQLLPGR